MLEPSPQAGNFTDRHPGGLGLWLRGWPMGSASHQQVACQIEEMKGFTVPAPAVAG
jgi:hypothetical protein